MVAAPRSRASSAARQVSGVPRMDVSTQRQCSSTYGGVAKTNSLEVCISVGMVLLSRCRK